MTSPQTTASPEPRDGEHESRTTSRDCTAPREAGELEIRAIKVHDLETFARATLASLQSGEVVPMSLSRACAQAKNPYADDGDVGLLVAYQGGRCIGYLTLLPGMLRISGRLEKIYRLSATYVAPQFRSTGAGGMLMLRALALRKDLVATEFSEDMARVYEALRFKPLGPLPYLMANFTPLNPAGMALRGVRRVIRTITTPRTTLLDGLIRAADSVWKKLLYLVLSLASRRLRREITAKRVDRVFDSTLDAAQDAAAPVRFFRGQAEINWMLSDRWVATDPARATAGYYFRDHDPLFEYIVLEVYGRNDRHYKGFVVLRTDGTAERRNITVFDYHFRDAADQRYLLPLALEQARRFLADVIKLPLRSRAALGGSRLTHRLFCEVERTYFCHTSGPRSPLRAALDRLELAFPDGDVSFA